MGYRLAVLDSHPIQYQAPLFRKISEHPEIDLVVYFCMDWGVREEYFDPGFQQRIKWDVPLLKGYSYRFLRNYSPLRSHGGFFGFLNPGIIRELWKGRYDAIIVHGWASMTNWLTMLGAKLVGTAVFMRADSVLLYTSPWWKSIIKRLILPFLFKRVVDAFLLTGVMNGDFYLHYGAPKDRLFLAPYAVDNEFFSFESASYRSNKDLTRKNLGLPTDAIIILFVGKLIKRKRPLDLLKAFEALSAAETKKSALVFVGDGEEKASLEEYVRHRAIHDVYFLGFQNQSALPKIYASADIFVLPSEMDPRGTVVNEAMACGLPIIISDKVGIYGAGDILRHGENGFVYPVGDIVALSGYLRLLIEDEDLRRRMGQCSLEIISKWNYDACIEGILKALEYVKRRGENVH